jgi:hypothetical protein
MKKRHGEILTQDGPSMRMMAMICVLLLLPGEAGLQAQQQQPGQLPATETVKLPAEKLESLVAPIALYPDPLLSQMLVASTYPLEVIQLQQWLAKNAGLKDQALADAVKKQPWDPSIQAMAGLPDAVKRLAENIQWTADLGNAFLAQQSEVMDAVQRMRQKAIDGGKLKTTEQQKVETKVVETKTVVVVEQANPQVVYVPSYDPVVVYGAAYAPYPYYAYYPPAGYYAAGMAISFGVGVAMGAMWGGGWGYGCGWGGNDIDINVNNNFNRNANINRSDNINRGSNANRGNNAGGATSGSTTRSTAVRRRIRTGLRRASMAGRREEIHCRTGRHRRGRTSRRWGAGSRRGPWTGAVLRIARAT